MSRSPGHHALRRQATCKISLVVLVAAACSEHVPTAASDSSSISISTPLIVSAPSAASVVPSSVRSRLESVRAVGVTSTSVYVSLPPGTVSAGDNATIRDDTNGLRETTSVMNGGFDPIAIPGNIGDELRVDVTGGAGILWTATVKVPPRRPPAIVRTAPPNGKTDVPLNTRVTVVFSTPMDPATIPGSIQLLTGGAAVAGTVELLPPGLVAELTPDQPLAPNAEYELLVTTAVKDLSGESLPVNVSVPFTTGSSTPPTLNAGIIAFQSSQGIESINADGTGRKLLIADSTASEPAWSPDGTRIAFTRASDKWNSCDIYTALADGSGMQKLTTPLTQPWCANTPAWSPDGTRIAFAAGTAGCPYSPQCGGQNIYVVDANGANEKLVFTPSTLPPITQWPMEYFILIRPSWSPDGAELAFECTYGSVDGPGPDVLVGICAGDATGANGRQLFWCCQEAPAWSPDGAQIAFQDNDHPGHAIGLMNANGTNVRNLVSSTATGANFGEPTWSPDGRQLAFTLGTSSGGTETMDLYVINLDGSGMRNLTVTGDVHHPSWTSLRGRTGGH